VPCLDNGVFIIGKDNLSSKLTVDSQDYIVFDLDSYQDVMYYRYNENRKSIIYVSVTLKWNRYLDLHFMIQLE
jgi:hypothetical protein